MYDVVLLPLFAWRYEKFDIDKHPWDEGARGADARRLRGDARPPRRPRADRGHGADRDRGPLRSSGSIPAGRAAARSGATRSRARPPRMEPPYNWTVVEEQHPWNHYKSGVCHYCAHCIVLMEEMPIDRFGYPVRVIDPPQYGHRSRPRSVRPEVPVEDVQGPDQGAGGGLHARRPHEARPVRLPGTRFAGPPDVKAGMPGAG